MKLKALILFLFAATDFMAQEQKTADTIVYPYFRKEEIIFEGKRYRIHNNYLTLGAGFGASSIRDQSQKNIGADYQFHIRTQHFQIGAMMSGNSIGDNNNIQAHLGYGYRIEKNKSNLAAFVGPTYFSGVEGDASSAPVFYDGFGAYFSVQAVSKFVYDVGLGAEIYADFSYKQSLFGLKIIAFFSNAYRGPKRNINPNVRSENPR